MQISHDLSLPNFHTKKADGHNIGKAPNREIPVRSMRVRHPFQFSIGKTVNLNLRCIRPPLSAGGGWWVVRCRFFFPAGGGLQANPRNVAYTNERLRLHMDLVYYESPPGLQASHWPVVTRNTKRGSVPERLYTYTLHRTQDSKQYFTLVQ